MANTINDLYLKYVNKVGATLEKDRYFQYLFEMVQAGSNVLQQKNQVLHKVVDERWLSTIEESLDAINAIIEKPRRFVTTKEEVVPVALAKKITADSVRHLSMNTQFIASNEDGDIQPTRVLNVSTEESYDLYENRFIYHLIQRLVTFIDKRTDVIFWSTGDEIRNTLSYQSKVDDAYEEIEYKVEMTVKNRQSFAENDSDNMQVFMRIDRVRRLVMALRTSSFCSLMAGCAKVRSPIQRTNLMMKDPNYRTCYKLWQFLERYEDVGYTIEVKDSALEFDEEYLFQLYTNLITNYTIFKSLLESDPRKMQEVATKQRKPIKPKFVKKIEEEIVDDYDIPDVEVRQVIIEEVTQAQLDAEAKLEEETKGRQEAEEALEELESQMIALQQQISSMMDMNIAAEEEAETQRQEKEAALEQLEAQRLETEVAQGLLKAEKEARETTEQEKSELETAMAQAQTEREQARANLEAVQEQAKNELEAAMTQAQTEREQARANLEAVQEQAKNELEAAMTQAQTEREQARANLEVVQEQAKSELETTIRQAEAELEAVKVQLLSEKEAIVEQVQTEKAQLEETLQAIIAQLTDERDRAREETAQALEEAQLQRQRADKESRARAKAQEKADANTLSKYILTALNSRKSKSRSVSEEQIKKEIEEHLEEDREEIDE